MSEPTTSAKTARAVTPRSVILGLLGVLFICTFTAYNDYAANNTFMVGNFLPIGLLLLILGFIILINAPLQRFAPRLAFGRAEIAVAMCMTLVSCAMPSSGLMRYLPAQLIGVWNKAGANADAADVLRQAKPPDWLFPAFERTGIAERARDPVVAQYMQRVALDEPTCAHRFMAVPWAKWALPAVTWGILVAMVMAAVFCIAVIFRRQWVENERLPYPLANVYLSLIEEPRPGRLLNDLFANRWFWIAASAVFTVHSLNALHRYFPRVAPAIPTAYDLNSVLRNAPFVHIEWGIKQSTIYFCIVGVIYFLQSNVALSLWFIYASVSLARMVLGSNQIDFTTGMEQDQSLGSMVVFAATILFIARHQLLLVARQMLRRPDPDEAQGRYLPYACAGWGLILCVGGIIAWMMLVGVTFAASLLITAFCGMVFLIVARVVAETGLVFVQVSSPSSRPWIILAQSMPRSLEMRTTTTSFFFTGWAGALFATDTRESISGFLPQALRIADGAAYGNERNWRRAIPFTLCLIAALAIAYIVSGAAMLYTEYNFGATLDRNNSSPINGHGVEGSVAVWLDATKNYINQGGPAETHNRWSHIGLGATITGFMGAMRLRFANWPFHPIGFLLVYTYPMDRIWFSILLGWLAKVLIVRFGGSTLYRAANPLFVGLIIGEASAAAFWLLVSLILLAFGHPYIAINLLPT